MRGPGGLKIDIDQRPGNALAWEGESNATSCALPQRVINVRHVDLDSAPHLGSLPGLANGGFVVSVPACMGSACRGGDSEQGGGERQ